MSEIKEFAVAVKAKDDKATQFMVADTNNKGEPEPVTLTAFQPDEAQFAMLMASTGRGVSDMDRIAGIINFFVNILEEDDADYLQGRLLNRNDDFGIPEVEAIMEWLSEEWTGNPTQGPSGSTPSSKSTGPASTERTPLLTS